MSIYWFSGYLDGAWTINPICLRGYDSAGNLLYSIRLNNIRDHDLSSLAGFTTALIEQQADFADSYRFIAGYDEWGTAKTLAPKDGFRYFQIPQREEFIRAIAVDADGWIYCAMSPVFSSMLKSGVTESQVRQARENAVSDGITKYHGWGIARPDSNPTSYYYQNLISYFSGDTDRYDRLYIDFFKVYRQNGDRVQFPDLHGGPVYAVAADNTYFYLAGEAVGANKYYLRKYDKSGTEQWATAVPTWYGAKLDRYIPASTQFGVFLPEYWQFEDRLVNSILIDGSGNLYLTGHTEIRRLGDDWNYNEITRNQSWIRKYNSSGTLQWERRITGFAITNIITDGTLFYTSFYQVNSGGFYYLPTQYRINTTDYYFDPTGQGPVETVAWNADGTIARYTARANTLSGGVYFVNDNTPALHLEYNDSKVYLSTGYSSNISIPLVTVYSITDLSVVSDVLTRTQHNAARNSYKYVDFRFDSSNNRVFSKIEIGYPSPYTDSNSQYLASPTVARHFYNYNSSGTQQWTTKTVKGWAYQGDLPSYTYAQATEPLSWGYNSTSGEGASWDLAIVNSPNLPAIQLPISLGIPTWIGDRYTAIPALALNIALAIPTWEREYVGSLALPDVYRLVLDGSPPLSMSMTSLTIRRPAFSRELIAVIVPPGIATLTTITERIGNTLTLYRGVRFADGTEQLEPMIDVPLSSIRADRGSTNFSITLSGAVEETENIQRTRTLRGISYRNIGADGRRRIRCAIDTYIRPGYTVIFGAESMIVGEITISISISSSNMEVLEASL